MAPKHQSRNCLSRRSRGRGYGEACCPFLFRSKTNTHISFLFTLVIDTSDSDSLLKEGLSGLPAPIEWYRFIEGVKGFRLSPWSSLLKHYRLDNGEEGGTQWWTTAAGAESWVKEGVNAPPDTDRSMGNGAMGRGLYAEPLVVSVAALQPSLRRWRWSAMVAH